MLIGLDIRIHPLVFLLVYDKPERLLAGEGWPHLGDFIHVLALIVAF